jgi:hypothetical protein
VIDPPGAVQDAERVLPALRAALLCEKLLTEADGVMSAIRMFSRVDLPPGAVVEATLLVMLANVEPSDASAHQIIVRLETEAAEVVGRQQFPIAVPREAGASFSLVLPFRLQAPAVETTFWLCCAYDTDDQLLTRLPLQFRPPVTE